jgi:hypothetical protein
MTTFIDGKLDRNRALYLLTMQDAAYRAIAEAWPKPRWCKYLADGDSIFVMVWLNLACAETFYRHCDPRRVIGHCDRMCFADADAAQCARNDFEAVASPGKIMEFFEPFGGQEPVRVQKLAFRVENEQLAGWFVYGECP